MKTYGSVKIAIIHINMMRMDITMSLVKTVIRFILICALFGWISVKISNCLVDTSMFVSNEYSDWKGICIGWEHTK
jgi:hypothetical protein